MADNSSVQSEGSLEFAPTLSPKAWMLDVLRGARERCAGRSFAAEYQQTPLGEQEQAGRRREME